MNDVVMKLLAFVVAMICVFILYKVRWKIHFSIRAIIALVVGIIIGYIFKGNTEYVGTVGGIFTKVISIMVIPLVMVSLIKSIYSMSSMNELRSIGVKGVFWLMFQTFLASAVAIFLAVSTKLGQGSSLSVVKGVEQKEVPGFSQVISDLFSNNLFQSMADGKILPVVIFSIFIGIAVVSISSSTDNKLEGFKGFIDDLYVIVIKIITKIVEFLPYAILCLMADTIANSDWSLLRSLVHVIVLAYIGCFFHVLVTESVLISIFAKVSPVRFFKAVFPAQVMAFTTTSSSATLPVAVKCTTENLGVRPTIANFVQSLSTSMGMAGCSGIWPSLLAVFAINMLNGGINPEQIVLILVLCPLISIGTAGVPGGGIMLSTALYLAMGLPVEYISIFVAIDSFVDMARTMTNVTGGMAATLMVDRSEPKQI